MDKNSHYTSDLDLAQLLLEKNGKEKVIAALFDLFEFDCLERCNTDPGVLDSRISAFERTGCVDPEQLAGIIGLIRAGKDTARQKEDALVRKIKSCIFEHLTEEITVEEIAEKLYISYYYMCHLFKRRTGISINTFRTRKRLEKAVRQLLGSEKKIADVATDCGFSSVSYFTETFSKMLGMTPAAFRQSAKAAGTHDFYRFDDMLLASQLPSVSLLSPRLQTVSNEAVHTVTLYEPNEQAAFLHETAIIEYHGVLYASWYSCPKKELQGYTPICGKRSYDGGKTWSELEIIAGDKSERILYCPPVYGIDKDTLYLLVNQMVAPDHIHSLDLYALNNETGVFELRWSRPIPFKLNTNVVTLPNGTLMLPGRMGEPDGFPNTPAVLISDSGRIDAEWRMVKIAENGDLPNGKQLVHPEITVLCREGVLYMFCRNDQSRVPLVYLSHDLGESWSVPHSHDVPCVSSKIYCGELKDGRQYMICNVDKFNRSRLAVYFTDTPSGPFVKQLILFDDDSKVPWGACHYPAAFESDRKLYVIATFGYENSTRGAGLFIIDLNKI